MRKSVRLHIRQGLALLCVLLLGMAIFDGVNPALAQDTQQYQQQDQDQGPEQPLLTPDQLDDLVTPIALYPDPLIAQILAASTYPLEVVQANRWVQANRGLQGTTLTESAAQQPWDPSVQALVVFPSVLEMMDKNLTWTTDLGNAFLAQEQDVMDAVQRQRLSASNSGQLTSNAQQTIERSNDNGKTIVIIQPAQPEIIYVPVYNPVVIWGTPRWHPWPPYWYPPRPRTGFVIGTGGFGFFFTISVSRYFHHWGGWNNWGWGCGWGGRNIVINNNFYVRNNYRPPRGIVRNGNTVWAHNPNHRAGVPYPNRGVAKRVGYPLPARPINNRPGVRPPGGTRPGPGNPNPGNRPGQPSIQPVRPGQPSTQPGRPGQPTIQPVRPGQPSTQPTRPGQPTIQPVKPGQPGTRPAPRPGTDKSALTGIQITPGDRAQIERDRGYSSLGNRAQTRPATTQRPATAPRPTAKPQAAPKPQARPAPTAKPAGKPR
jgi:Protein of unknown function (DUF3300)